MPWQSCEMTRCFFKEQMLVWLDTILVAHKKTEQCAMAYRYLQDAVNQSLTSAHSGLVRSYLDTVILALESHA